MKLKLKNETNINIDLYATPLLYDEFKLVHQRSLHKSCGGFMGPSRFGNLQVWTVSAIRSRR